MSRYLRCCHELAQELSENCRRSFSSLVEKNTYKGVSMSGKEEFGVGAMSHSTSMLKTYPEGKQVKGRNTSSEKYTYQIL